ncbi:hypothetical protein EJ03DRAFT_177269 [Teratosphaeria nubilosa]|uniref:EI24-domain-containing protein n=1 Tax=Teratosphaeria nubilosa TaxID=161662 RepID=A0A6G1L1G7_9PEZI|nr:hypothetical protein EJ03DRAFT_177269 [Teratosphaeria nubilosa]
MPALQGYTNEQSWLRRYLRSNFSPAFLYPLKGIWYFATHRYLHPLFKSRLLPLTLLSVCTLAILFLTAYLPIVAFLALFHLKGSAWVNGTVLVLEMGTLLIAILFEALFVDHTQVDIFDGVLISEGYEDLVKNRRVVSDDVDQCDPVTRLGSREKGACFAPFSIRQLVEFVIFLPLNFIPFAGVPLFLLLTGYRAGPLLNRRYFQLKGFTRKQRNQFIATKKRKWEYMWFGTVYMVLQLIPLLNMFFLLTGAVGSALWSVHIEEEIRARESWGQTDDQDLPPQYSDDADDI